MIKKLLYMLLLFSCIIFYGIEAKAEGGFTVSSEFTTDHLVRIKMTMENNSDIDGFDIYRSDKKDGDYSSVGTVSSSDYYYDDDNGDNTDNTVSYTDESILSSYTTYYYRITSFQYKLNRYGYKSREKITLTTNDISIFYPGAGPVITVGKRSGKNGSSLAWSAISEADGYMIYCLTDMDERGNMIWPDTDDENLFTLVSTQKGSSNTTASFGKLTNGVTYYYRIYAYKTIDGNNVKSFSSDIMGVAMDYYAYAGESYTKKIKRAFGSEKKMKKNFKSASKARKQMKTIKIKVWDYKKGKKGKKITRTKYLTVNKKLAPTIKQIFKEIYKSKEKQVIHDIGCYSYRKGEHMYGLAIDVNPDENYMIDGKKILAGRYWKPKKDPYSIPNDSDFVRIMNRYGFYRGEWGKRKDYMHFSYFGT